MIAAASAIAAAPATAAASSAAAASRLPPCAVGLRGLHPAVASGATPSVQGSTSVGQGSTLVVQGLSSVWALPQVERCVERGRPAALRRASAWSAVAAPEPSATTLVIAVQTSAAVRSRNADAAPLSSRTPLINRASQLTSAALRPASELGLVLHIEHAAARLGSESYTDRLKTAKPRLLTASARVKHPTQPARRPGRMPFRPFSGPYRTPRGSAATNIRIALGAVCGDAGVVGPSRASPRPAAVHRGRAVDQLGLQLASHDGLDVLLRCAHGAVRAEAVIDLGATAQRAEAERARPSSQLTPTDAQLLGTHLDGCHSGAHDGPTLPMPQPLPRALWADTGGVSAAAAWVLLRAPPRVSSPELVTHRPHPAGPRARRAGGGVRRARWRTEGGDEGGKVAAGEPPFFGAGRVGAGGAVGALLQRASLAWSERASEMARRRALAAASGPARAADRLSRRRSGRAAPERKV